MHIAKSRYAKVTRITSPEWSGCDGRIVNSVTAVGQALGAGTVTVKPFLLDLMDP